MEEIWEYFKTIISEPLIDMCPVNESSKIQITNATLSMFVNCRKEPDVPITIGIEVPNISISSLN